jgi:hypothetical protein
MRGSSVALQVQTRFDGELLSLHTNLPRDALACALLGAGDACLDRDADGLADGWEDIALDRLRPFVMLDEDEQLVRDENVVTAIVGRVAPIDGLIHVYMMLGYSNDYGSCGLTGHHGDSERVALALEPATGGGAGDVRVVAAYTAAHEHAPNDHSRRFTRTDLGLLTFADDPATGEPRWAVYASRGKHASYASRDLCESVSRVPCLEEDCSPDGVADPARFQLLMRYVNAGEEAAPLVTDLGSLGFAGEDAWAERRFCGGLGGDDCASPVRDKLLRNPFLK